MDALAIGSFLLEKQSVQKPSRHAVETELLAVPERLPS
jgi:hypothetical protein